MCAFNDYVYYCRWLITFMQTPEEPSWHGYLYAVCLLIVGTLCIFLKNSYFKKVFTIAVRIRTSLMADIYNKVP